MHKNLAKLICIVKGDYQSPDVIPQYELLDLNPDQLAVYHIKEGLYKGTQYRCGKVSFMPDGNTFKLSFTTDIIKHPWWGKIKDDDMDFTQITGNILSEIMNSGDYSQFLVL